MPEEAAMTERERYLATLLFEQPDRIPLHPGGPRQSTLRAWQQQGLPDGVPWYEAMLEAIGLPPVDPGGPGIDVSFQMIPTFEEKVLEHKDGHYIVQDWMGAITEISDEFDYTYIRSAKDFVTRKWHKFPVETREDWERMRERFQVDTPGRFGENFVEQCRALQTRDHILGVSFNGPFWQLREWCGFENLCMLFIEDPEFVREMVDFWTEFVSQVLARVNQHITLDTVGLSEDMAYKAHSMISPAMTREFLLPSYRRWVEELNAAGCRVINMDSDGYIGELIPIWIEAGINVCCPIEVAAHNDIVEFRRQFGTQMAYTGGLDKRELAAGGERLEAEVRRVVPPLLEQGGFIPGCDHGVPPDISWPNFVHYSRLLAQYGGWL
jgi:uroporphyrinogen decarboxylase